MALDHQVYHTLTGKYTYMATPAPQIPHPVILADGMHFYCLSTSPAADGTRAGDWHHVNLSGVRPVCSCRGFAYRGECPHIGLVAAQVDDLCRARTARWQAERVARRGQIVAPPPPPVLYCTAQDAYLLPDEDPAA
jgi:hypothetical protein